MNIEILPNNMTPPHIKQVIIKNFNILANSDLEAVLCFKEINKFIKKQIDEGFTADIINNINYLQKDINDIIQDASVFSNIVSGINGVLYLDTLSYRYVVVYNGPFIMDNIYRRRRLTDKEERWTHPNTNYTCTDIDLEIIDDFNFIEVLKKI